MNRLPTFILSILFLLFWSTSSFAVVDILSLRHWSAPDHTRIVIDTSDEVQFTVEKSPQKVILNLKNAALLKTMPNEFILDKPAITRVTFSSLLTNDVQVKLFLDKDADTNVFRLKQFQDKPYRVVVDITLPEVEKEKVQTRERIKVIKKDKIVVIDPGHGGEDPGAVGRRGTSEKEVVLEIGKKLRDLLNAGNGVQAFLTREGDYYVSFKKRLSIARELGADLFISVHADAAKNRAANGSSVYCLSTVGAGSEAAKILARKENMADIVGGTVGEDNSSDESDPIILNMFQTNTINQSKTFGGKIINNLCRINNIKFSSVQEAPFRVLKLPEIPAVLIETAYISNPQEERNLRDGRYQKKIANSIVHTVREFFSLPEQMDRAVTVADGKIKQKVKGLDVGAPKLKTSVYKVKKVLPPIHKVRKGDTLDKIARKYGTKVGVLLKLNHIKPNDPLYLDREIKLPYKRTPGQG